MSETVIPGAFDDPNYTLKVSFTDISGCDFCNRKNVKTATVWWTQPEVRPAPSHHTFMVICSECVEAIRKSLEGEDRGG